MSTRGGSAARALGAKRVLVNVLFGHDKKTINYAALRLAYLERIKALHPDLNRGNRSKESRGEFQSLQDAWFHYESFAKQMKKVENGGAEADFTLFGVGCSFSDNEEERQLRSDIMDQAGRGWFHAGALSSGDDSPVSGANRKKAESLLTLDEFSDKGRSKSSGSKSFSKEKDNARQEKAKSLVAHLLPPRHRLHKGSD